MADKQAPGPPASALGPFRHGIFRSVWIATLASSFGGMIQGVGAAWMMVALGASAQMVTLVQASITLPIVILALVAGALADAFDRRKLMLAAQIFMLVVSGALAVSAYFEFRHSLAAAALHLPDRLRGGA